MTRTLKTLAAALIVGLAAAPAANAKAKSTFTITGAGFGHGVGMSQYGALGYAEHGWNATAILEHYYTGTTLGTTDPTQRVRVLLVGPSKARITGAGEAGTRKLNPGLTYTVRRHGVSQVDLYNGAKRVGTFTSPLQVAGADGATTLGGYGSYRGVLEFTPGTFSGLTIVNSVGLDDYVQGVVPAESPASWPLEALKAQAIAARTYADNPTAFHLRAMNMLYEGLKSRNTTIVIVPSTAVESMQLGGIAALSTALRPAAAAQAAPASDGD